MSRRPEPTLRLTVECRMRQIRGARPLRAMHELSGVSPGTLSQLERGERLPRPEMVGRLERAYGPHDRWYVVELKAGS